MTKTKLITSKQILAHTGISRATLNNYIKLGILPRPVINSPGSEQQGVKQIGFFPADALTWIEQVKFLKKQGNSMDKIATLFQDKGWIEKLNDTGVNDDKIKRHQQKGQLSLPEIDGQSAREIALHVTCRNLTSPAYMVNNNLEIEWINEPAENIIFHRRISSIPDVKSRHIFKLLLDQDIHGPIQNWRDALVLHCTILQRHLDSSILDLLYDGLPDQHVTAVKNSYRNRMAPAKDNLYHLPFTLVEASSGNSQVHSVYSIAFTEGTLLVFVPIDQSGSQLMDILSHREKFVLELSKNRMPSMVSLCALVASLHNSEKLRTELLPAQFFLLINEVRQAAGPVFDKYYGTYGQHTSNKILYYFVESNRPHYLSNAINCAIELHDVMSVLSVKWKNKIGWDHDLSWNIGIHEGREFSGSVQTGGNIEFTSVGDSVQVAEQLAAFAGNGETWVTKDVITKMPTREQERFHFGVYGQHLKRRKMQPASFSLAGDLIDEVPLPGCSVDLLSNLAVTEIIGHTGAQKAATQE